MIGYVTLGTNELVRAAKFYDQLCAELGAKRIIETDRLIAWGRSMAEPSISMAKPYDGRPASVGNGVMVALQVASSADVDRVHKRALGLGAKDEGPTGPRGGGAFYAGYFRDPDGNKLNVFCMTVK